MQTVTLVAVFALIWKFVDFVKFITNKDVNGVVTQAATWAGGIALAFIVSASDFGATWNVNGILFNDMAWGTKVIVGLLAGSAGSALYDFKVARDNTDSSVTPSLLPGSSDPVKVVVHPTTPEGTGSNP